MLIWLYGVTANAGRCYLKLLAITRVQLSALITQLTAILRALLFRWDLGCNPPP